MTVLGITAPAAIATFDEIEVDASRFIAVASPAGRIGSGYQLLVIEQVSNERPCWSEATYDVQNPTINNPTLDLENPPVVVDLLLKDFNFTGICRRSVDATGYSLRVGQQDLGIDYALRIRVVEDSGEVILVAEPFNATLDLPELEIGRTRGLAARIPLRIDFNPGWRITRRAYDGQPTAHLYVSNDRPLAQLVNPTPEVAPSAPPVPEPSAIPQTYPLPAPQPQDNGGL